jgi:hypothetical protein
LYGATSAFASDINAQTLAVIGSTTSSTFFTVWAGLSSGVGYIAAGSQRGGTTLLGLAQSCASAGSAWPAHR